MKGSRLLRRCAGFGLAVLAALLVYELGGLAQQQVPFDKTYNIPVPMPALRQQ